MDYTPESFTEELKKTFGNNLKSVVLYGSAAAGHHHKDYSDYNLLLVLERFDAAACRAAAGVLKKWVKPGNPAPLIFTDEELRRFENVFPIELLDMQEHRNVLYGQDPLAGFAASGRNLRLELERDLRSNLLKLRQAYWLSASEPKRVQELMIQAGSTFLVLFRSALRLLNVAPLPPKPEAASALSRRIPFDAEVFAHIERLKSKDRAARGEPPEWWMERLLESVGKVIDAIDKL